MEREETTAPLTAHPQPVCDHVYSGPPRWRSSRYVMAYMILLGNASMFFMRVTFSMVIVCMVNHTALDLPALQRQHTYYITNVSASGVPHTHHFGEGELLPLNDSTSGVPYTHHFGEGELLPVNASAPGIIHDADVLNDDTTPLAWAGNKPRRRSGDSARPTVSGERDEEDARCGKGEFTVDNPQEKEDGPFVWDKATQGLLLGGLYWGYMVSQIVAGYVVYHLGPRLVCGTSMLVMSVLTMLCHPAAYWSPWAVFALRVGVGVCNSHLISAMYAVWGRWAPVAERATLISLAFSGQNIANAVGLPTAALLCKHGFAGGWPSVFHVYGALGLAWSVGWLLLASDSPETSTRIHPEERRYILANRPPAHPTGEKVNVPWRQILTAPCFWAVCVAHFSFNWGLFLFMSNLPLYMNEVMNFDIKSNGVYSMMPYIALGCVQMVSGFVADGVVKRHYLSVFWARRVFNALTNLLPAGCVVVVSYLGCRDVAAVMTLLVTGLGFTGFGFASFLVNPLDIAPAFAISIMSISNTLGCIPGILTPYLVAALTQDKTREQWQVVFFITAAVYVFGSLFFWVFCKTDLQPWATPAPITIDVDDNDLELDEGHTVKVDGELLDSTANGRAKDT